MTDKKIQASHGTPFAPRALVPVAVGRTSVNLYAVIDPGMHVEERAHAFQINKTALASTPVDLRVQLDALGQQLNLAATVDGVRDDWLRFFHDSWCDFSRLSILSFHNDAGGQINDTTMANNTAILLPVIDGILANCRRPNVKFVRVQITLDFRSLVSVDPPGLTTLRVEYYVELPQTSRAMMNGAGGGYNLVTYHGPDDLRTQTTQQVHDDILSLTLQDGPFDLQPASFNLTTARTDGTALRSEIEGKILRLAYPTICNTLFLELCPGYSNQPHAALDHIRQVHYDRDGNQVVSTVQAYFQQLMNASRPFSSQREFPISVCQKFQDGLDPRLITGFRRFFSDHSIVQPLASTHQRKVLQLMLTAAQQAEDEYASTQRIAREAIGMSQAFPVGVVSGGFPLAPAFPSQAETTLTRYSAGGGGYSTDGNSRATDRSGGRGPPRSWNCFGCGGPHPYSEYKDGQHIVICPNKDAPGVRENANKNIEKMRKNRKKKHVQNQKRKNLGTANYADFDEAGRERIREQCLAAIGGNEVSDNASALSSVTGPGSYAPSAGRGRGRGSGGSRVFVVDVSVLAATTPLKPQMPISIQSNLPHIPIKFGNDLNDPNCPTIRCAVDTCAALTTGSFHFFAAIAKCYPHCVQKIFAPQDYASIVLMGIVRNKSEAVTTELEVGFLFSLPYKTSDGDDSSFMVATGPHVSVNTIIGLPFIKGVGMIFDTVDDVAECKYLDCPPFPIDYRRTSNTVPVMDEPSVPVHHAHSSYLQQTIQEIVNLEQYYDAKVQGQGSRASENYAVRFGSTSAARDAVSDSESVNTASTPKTDMSSRWVPPSSVNEETDDYHSQVLGEDGYLPPCRRVSTYSTGAAFAPIDPTLAPIRVAPKPKRRKRTNNVFLDDRGFRDLSDDYDHVLHDVDGGPILRKLRHPAPALDDDIDPAFHAPFVPDKHDNQMRKDLDLSHLDPNLRERIYAIIRKYWSVFDEKGVFVPVKNYECVIDTGTARPISVKKILYGERETIIMRKCIAALDKVGHIVQTTEGEWMFKALLAAKPHQEHIRCIDEFVWRFCVNFIPLNSVTKLIAYPIPRCDSAVFNEFGQGRWRWMFDAPMGYHQLAVALESQDKLAFQGVDAIKWKYTVMPFGPTNGPATFINFIYDINSVWQKLAKERGVQIDEDTNTKIIIDDIVSYANQVQTALTYMECQLIVCQAYRLSLNLRKSFIFPQRFEFVGIDVCDDGNRPAKSKHSLLQTWPQPELVRDVAKFIGFAQFYSRFIHHFEIRITPLRDLTKLEYTEPVAPHWTPAAQAALDDMKEAILSDPCLLRFDYRKLIVLRTDFSKDGFGYVLCQPASDDDTLKAVQDYRDGKGFSFMTKSSSAALHPVCFGARRSRGNEVRLHSHLGEGFAGDYAINKCSHMLFGQRFVWVTDCYAIKFILSYEGGNSAILRLQMRLMCWDVDIVHRPDTELVDADYWSRLGVDLEFDPLLRGYLAYALARRHSSPPPTDLPMRPENMPYYRGPRIQESTEQTVSADALHIQSLITDIVSSFGCGHTHLSNVPIRFGEFNSAHPPPRQAARTLLNSEFASYARQAQQFDWAVYSFSNGHFSSSVQSHNLPFQICLACDPYESGRSLFQEFAASAKVFNSGNDLLNHIRASGETSVIHGYLINSYRFQTSEVTTSFWKLQLSIIAQLRLIRSLSIVVAIVIPDHDGRSISVFKRGLTAANWKVSSRDVSYEDIGDSVADSCTIIIAIHSSCASKVEPIQLKTPPSVTPRPIGAFVWEPFNKIEHSLSPGREDEEFDSKKMIATIPKPVENQQSRGVTIKYHLHRADSDAAILAGSSVLSSGGLCPPFESCPNRNLFQQFFGIEFIHDGHTHVRAISTYEFARCFGLVESIQYRLSHEKHKFGLDTSMPGRTSAWLFEQIHSHLVYLRDANSEVFSPNQFAARAATIQTLVSGAICTRLPSKERWVQAYANDSELSAVRELALNPSLISTQTLSKVNHNYRGPLRHSLISVEDDMLIFREPISGSDSYTRLTLVPSELYNILFIAFHANPIGGHLNAYRTLHRLRLRYYWPGMYAYVKRMCQACPGCALSNPTRGKSSELVYNFPVEAPFLVIHFDAYAAGKHSGFEGSDVYLIGCCGMCSFACMEPVTNPSATTFASAIMKILLRYGFCHTAVLDKDTKFYGVCREALDLLQINCHVLSGANHNPMLVERVNRYLTKGLKIMCNERDSVRIANEAILLLLYAWNSCPVPGTDISRSLVAVGREFAFPIDYSRGKHWELTSSPSTVVTYSKELATRLSACREVAELLVQEQRAYHRELINARRPNPRVYSIGDIVFARRAVKSSSAKEQVDKLQYAFTGPWVIKAQLKGASYELEHCEVAGKREKKHAADLSPYPVELIPFHPVDGADSRYGQLYKPIGLHPFKEAGIKGFAPLKPFKVAANLATTGRCTEFHWPSLSELNDEIAPFQWHDDAEFRRYMDGDSIATLPVLNTGPPPAAPQHTIPTIPAIHLLTAAIIQSSDKLFFVSHSIGSNNAREWRLARVAFQDSMSIYPSCTQDGRYLFEFYICHPSDWRYNAINQRYWLQYHGLDEVATPSPSTDAHLIRPSDTSDSYANRHKLVPFRKWLNISHLDTFIHGPFDFASIRGRKSRDRISQDDWDILGRHTSMFNNPLPKFDVPTYSIHVDRGAHVTYHDKALCDLLLFEASRTSNSASDRRYL